MEAVTNRSWRRWTMPHHGFAHGSPEHNLSDRHRSVSPMIPANLEVSLIPTSLPELWTEGLWQPSPRGLPLLNLRFPVL